MVNWCDRCARYHETYTAVCEGPAATAEIDTDIETLNTAGVHIVMAQPPGQRELTRADIHALAAVVRAFIASRR